MQRQISLAVGCQSKDSIHTGRGEAKAFTGQKGPTQGFSPEMQTNPIESRQGSKNEDEAKSQNK